MPSELKSRLELLALTGVASAGAFLCSGSHYCGCGHLAHGQHARMEPWILDGIWLFALAATAVVGIGGRFHGARPVGIVSALLVVCIAASRSPLYGLDALVLFILFFVQVWELFTFMTKQPKSDEAVPSNPCQSSSSDDFN